MRIRCAVTLAIAAAVVAPGNVSAADSNNGSSIDVSAGVSGDRVMAGVRWGSPGGSGGYTDDCEWSVSMPRDSHGGDEGDVVKVVGSTT